MTDAVRHPLKVQWAVVHALLVREMLTRYGRNNVGFLWLFLEPMAFTLGVTVLWTFTGLHTHSTLPIVAFAVTGYSSVLLWRNMPARCVNAIEPNLALLYHRQVKVLDVFLARLLLEAAGATGSFMVLGLLFTALGWMQPPEDALKVVCAWLMLAWFGVALAMLLGGLASRTELVDKVWHPSAYLLFPLSGAGFMVDWLPASAQAAVGWLPMVHGIEFLRDGYFGARVRTHYDLGYLALVSLALSSAALLQVRVAGRRVHPE